MADDLYKENSDDIRDFEEIPPSMLTKEDYERLHPKLKALYDSKYGDNFLTEKEKIHVKL